MSALSAKMRAFLVCRHLLGRDRAYVAKTDIVVFHLGGDFSSE
jgi:hypothetical protein